MVVAVASATPTVPVISPATPRHFSSPGGACSMSVQPHTQRTQGTGTKRWPGTPTSLARLACGSQQLPASVWQVDPLGTRVPSGPKRAQTVVTQGTQPADAAHSSTSRLSLNGFSMSVPLTGFATPTEELSSIGHLLDTEVVTAGSNGVAAEGTTLGRPVTAVALNSAPSNGSGIAGGFVSDFTDVTPLLPNQRRVYPETARRSRTLSPIPRRNALGELVEPVTPAPLPVRRRSVEWAESPKPAAAMPFRSVPLERAESATPTLARNSRGMTSRRTETEAIDARDRVRRVKRRMRPYRILCYGDSLTAGFCSGGKHFEPYGLILGELLSATGLPCEVTICGLVGLTAQELVQGARSSHVRDISKKVGRGLIRILEDDPPQDLVILMAGTNDLGYKMQAEAVFENVRYLHESCHALGVPTVSLVPPAPLFPRFRIERTRLAAFMSEWVQAAPGVIAIADCEALVPRAGWAALDDTLVSGCRRAASVGVSDILWDPDVIHMSAKGSNLLARRLLPLVAPILQRIEDHETRQDHVLPTAGSPMRRSSAMNSPLQRDRRRPGGLEVGEVPRSAVSSTAPPSPLPVQRPTRRSPGSPCSGAARNAAASPVTASAPVASDTETTQLSPKTWRATARNSTASFPIAAEAAPCVVALAPSPSEVAPSSLAHAARPSAAAAGAPTSFMANADLLKKSVASIVIANGIKPTGAGCQQEPNLEDSKPNTLRPRPASMAIPVSSPGTVVPATATTPSAASATLAVAGGPATVLTTAPTADATPSCLAREARLAAGAAAAAVAGIGLAGGLSTSLAAPAPGAPGQVLASQRGREAWNSAPRIMSHPVRRRPIRARSSSSGVRMRTHACERSTVDL